MPGASPPHIVDPATDFDRVIERSAQPISYEVEGVEKVARARTVPAHVNSQGAKLNL
jgi:hypothetical protein